MSVSPDTKATITKLSPRKTLLLETEKLREDDDDTLEDTIKWRTHLELKGKQFLFTTGLIVFHTAHHMLRD